MILISYLCGTYRGAVHRYGELDSVILLCIGWNLTNQKSEIYGVDTEPIAPRILGSKVTVLVMTKVLTLTG
jgi:hypothetical protein